MNMNTIRRHRLFPHVLETPATVVGGLCAWLALGAGCTHHAVHRQQLETKLVREAAVNNRAAADALNAQPTPQRDEYTETARRFVEQNERVLGTPPERIDVPSLVQSNATVVAAVERRFEAQNELAAERAQATDRLVELGATAEAARNQRLKSWARRLGWGGLGLGGVVAVIIFVPAALPVFGRLLGWLVGKLPGLAGAVGVVGVKAFDAVVRGVERFKKEPASIAGAAAAGPAAPGAQERLLGHLSHELDADHKRLVRDRRRRLDGKV